MFKVTKKDGTQEDFDRAKLVNGLVAAGATQEEAEKVAGEVEAWLPSVAQDGAVMSSDIRSKGLEVLGQVNPDVAAKFGSFQKPTEA